MKKKWISLRSKRLRAARAASGFLVLSFMSVMSAAEAPAEELTGIATLVVSQVQAGQGAPDQTIQADTRIGAKTVVGTGPGSAVALAMADGTEIAIGSDAEVTFADMVYDAASNIGKMTIEISAGVIRFATGSLAKSSYEIRTPSAVTAVRGTIVTVYVSAGGSTYLAVEEGMVQTISRRGSHRFDVPLGAALFVSTTGASDGALFSPLNGADLSQLPQGERPAEAVSQMDATLLAAASQGNAADKTVRALGLPYAIEKGLIKAEDLPAFASKTPAYTSSMSNQKSDKGGGY